MYSKVEFKKIPIPGDDIDLVKTKNPSRLFTFLLYTIGSFVILAFVFTALSMFSGCTHNEGDADSELILPHPKRKQERSLPDENEAAGDSKDVGECKETKKCLAQFLSNWVSVNESLPTYQEFSERVADPKYDAEFNAKIKKVFSTLVDSKNYSVFCTEQWCLQRCLIDSATEPVHCISSLSISKMFELSKQDAARYIDMMLSRPVTTCEGMIGYKVTKMRKHRERNEKARLENRAPVEDDHCDETIINYLSDWGIYDDQLPTFTEFTRRYVDEKWAKDYMVTNPRKLAVVDLGLNALNYDSCTSLQNKLESCAIIRQCFSTDKFASTFPITKADAEMYASFFNKTITEKCPRTPKLE